MPMVFKAHMSEGGPCITSWAQNRTSPRNTIAQIVIFVKFTLLFSN